MESNPLFRTGSGFTVSRALQVLGLSLAVALVAVLGLRLLGEGPPDFVIEDQILIEASGDEVWAVLVDFAAYPEWNPYVLAVNGDAIPGGIIQIRITQENWPEPMELSETVIALEPGTLFHWHGSVLTPGLLETDHSFRIEAHDEGRVRFVHREEFRGAIAGLVEADARVFTKRAFFGMDQALAARVAALRNRD